MTLFDDETCPECGDPIADSGESVTCSCAFASLTPAASSSLDDQRSKAFVTTMRAMKERQRRKREAAALERLFGRGG